MEPWPGMRLPPILQLTPEETIAEPLKPKDIDLTINTYRELRDRAHEEGQTAALAEILKTMAAAEAISRALLHPNHQPNQPAPPRDIIDNRGPAPQTQAGVQRRQ